MWLGAVLLFSHVPCAFFRFVDGCGRKEGSCARVTGSFDPSGLEGAREGVGLELLISTRAEGMDGRGRTNPGQANLTASFPQSDGIAEPLFRPRIEGRKSGARAGPRASMIICCLV